MTPTSQYKTVTLQKSREATFRAKCCMMRLQNWIVTHQWWMKYSNSTCSDRYSVFAVNVDHQHQSTFKKIVLFSVVIQSMQMITCTVLTHNSTTIHRTTGLHIWLIMKVRNLHRWSTKISYEGSFIPLKWLWFHRETVWKSHFETWIALVYICCDNFCVTWQTQRKYQTSECCKAATKNLFISNMAFLKKMANCWMKKAHQYSLKIYQFLVLFGQQYKSLRL